MQLLNTAELNLVVAERIIPFFREVQTGYPDAIRAELGITNNLAIVLCISIGYPDLGMPLNQYRSLRREINEYIRWSGF